MPEGADADPVGEDTLLGGRVRLLQPRRGHRAGTDAVLVAAAVEAHPGEIVIDLGAGTGAVGLAVAARTPGVRCVLVERDSFLAGLCRENLRLNGLDGTGRVVEADATAPRRVREAAGLASGMAEAVATNPPFSEAGRTPRSPDPRRAAAHELPPGGFKAWTETCADLLRPRGRLALIQRADRLFDCFDALRPRFGSFRVWPVYPRAEAGAIRVIVTAVRDGRGALDVRPPVVLHGPDGRFTPQAEALHRGEPLLRS